MRRGCLVAIGIAIVLILASIGWFVWQRSDASLPPVAKGMTERFDDGGRLFKARIARLYPLGSSERRLTTDLTAQGFTLRRAGDATYAELHRFIGCGDKVWSVNWRAANDRLIEVQAMYGPVCM